MMRANAYSWYSSEMKELTMEQKRERIIEEAELIVKGAKEDGFQFGSLNSLKESICYIMGWVKGTVSDGYGWKRKVYVIPDMFDDKCLKTIENMSNNGIITISKSGRGFKLNIK